VEPKLLQFPFDTEQLYEYNIRRCPVLEDTYAYGLHTEIDVGVPINLVDPSVYDIPRQQSQLHELDRAITNPTLSASNSSKKIPGSWFVYVSQGMPWCAVTSGACALTALA
jgi:hypothetical protein